MMGSKPVKACDDYSGYNIRTLHTGESFPTIPPVNDKVSRGDDLSHVLVGKSEFLTPQEKCYINRCLRKGFAIVWTQPGPEGLQFWNFDDFYKQLILSVNNVRFVALYYLLQRRLNCNVVFNNASWVVRDEIIQIISLTQQVYPEE